MIQIENLVKRYGNLVAVDHLDLEIRKGEIFGLLGPNGCGKTTTMNCMLALLKYDKGSIKIFGEEMQPDSYDIKKRIGVVMQNVAVFRQMTVYENIDYFCSLYVPDRKKRKQLVEEAIAFTGLDQFRKMRPGKAFRRPSAQTEHCLRHCPQAGADLYGRAYCGGRSPEPE